MEEARNNPSMATGEGQEQDGGYSLSTTRQKESPFCNIDGHLPLQKERGVRTHISEVHCTRRLWSLSSLH